MDRLEMRPFHGDEAVQAVKAGELLDGGQYIYNPYEFHGPSLYYFTLPVLKLRGVHCFADARDADFRLVPVMSSPESEVHRALLERIRAAGSAKARSGPEAARSQDFLYGDKGMPG